MLWTGRGPRSRRRAGKIRRQVSLKIEGRNTKLVNYLLSERLHNYSLSLYGISLTYLALHLSDNDVYIDLGGHSHQHVLTATKMQESLVYVLQTFNVARVGLQCHIQVHLLRGHALVLTHPYKCCFQHVGGKALFDCISK